ncbi:helix-turn-helix transcriptional regulator [Frankia sp. AgB1.9]|uniref:ArsR/SmtB family transcription factor n=1 Tax=unclassified Frankia TaxID=2632575 RepID=UPI0019314CD9|nr:MULTISPECIES: metalloregulator ArsR/SmtB family transcription factor [unclassified Frankia]MBL7489133.1 helix-turn-helix transcriptional regulator [Frankia sp. AgW1.1]MBL7550574.1 helix-turn-helix transcriptional regulator [Frankia sp. AgB1.9]MBL7619833.1 helix-turn-helix transcriptional regulator [Frankia sp. AgB1.8]
MTELPGPAAEDIDLVTVLGALSEPTRLAIVAELARCVEMACGRLLDGRIVKSTLSHHLRVLREAGVIATRAEGTTKYSRLRCADLDARFPGLLGAVLAGAPNTEGLGAATSP